MDGGMGMPGMASASVSMSAPTAEEEKIKYNNKISS